MAWALPVEIRSIGPQTGFGPAESGFLLREGVKPRDFSSRLELMP